MNVTPFALERFFSQTEFNVRYHLASSAIMPWTLREFLNMANDPDLQFSLFATRLGYTEPEGIPDLRREISRLYKVQTGPGNVFVTIGAIEANYLLLSTLLQPGDRFIVQIPYYQQLPQVGIDLGAKPLFWKYHKQKGFDIQEFELLLEQSPRLVMLNTPHNPTGAVFSADEMRQIAGLCAERDVLLIADEVYRELSNPLLPSFRDLSPQSVCIGSMSKAYGLAGLRVGWIAGPLEIIEGCATKRDYTSLCAPTVAQQLALTALKHRTKIWERNRLLRQKNIKLLETVVKDSPFLSWKKPEAGVVAWLGYAQDISSEQVGWDLHRQGVLIAPGIFFGEENHLRLGFGGNSGELESGLAILADYFKQY